MRELCISLFKNRFDKNPKPLSITWPDLISRLSKFKRRKHKDGALWSPCKYSDGEGRGNSGVSEMHGVALDFDCGVKPDDLSPRWDEMGLAYVIHSTWHNEKSKPDEPPVPRWRVFFPLSKPITAKGWQRKYIGFATFLGGDMFDRSCADPARMHYFPAAPHGVGIISKVRDGRFLEPCEALEIKDEQAAPPSTAKHGPSDESSRPGSDYSSNGDHRPVLQNSGWQYLRTRGSNEQWRRPGKESGCLSATWHTEKRAFYVFTSGTSLQPSRSYSLFALRAHYDHSDDYSAMARQLKGEGYGGSQALALVVSNSPNDKAEPKPVEPKKNTDIMGPDDWQRGIVKKLLKDGTPVMDSTAGNLALLLAHDERWKNCIAYDLLDHHASWMKSPPSIPGWPAPSGRLSDEHTLFVQQAAVMHWNIRWGTKSVEQAVMAAAHMNAFHPVENYLKSLEWDGEQRVERWLETYLNAEPQSIPVGRWWLISAVARAMRPGCQVDHCLILESGQGTGKSSAMRILAGQWYQGDLGDLSKKDAPQSLRGVWLVEIGELEAFRGKASTQIKSFISQVDDFYRPSYGRFQKHHPRSCIFSGTTNDSAYLQDATGSRRFWPVRVGMTDREAMRRDRDQLWAEATSMYMDGKTWWPEDIEQVQELAMVADERFRRDPWEECLSDWLSAQMGDVSIGDCLSRLEIDKGRRTLPDAHRVGRILKRLKWVKSTGKGPRTWKKLNDSD